METPFPIATEEEEKESEGFIVPECCKKGLPDCPHRAKKPEEKRANIGL